MPRERLDKLLHERGLSESREKGQRLIRTGRVRVAGHPECRPGHKIDIEAEITVKETERFVSRGGEKLAGALEAWPDIDLKGRICIDAGASTGGFTDCMLQEGAVQVYAVDVGHGQLHWKLRSDERVVVMERTNARYIEACSFDPPPDFATADLSFISLTKVLPAVTKVLAPQAELVTLIKPQFEAGREQVERGGVVRDPAVHEAVCAAVKTFGENELGLKWKGIATSPLKGPKGNIEFLAWWEKIS